MKAINSTNYKQKRLLSYTGVLGSTFRLLSIAVILLSASCANRGVGPQGGPKDSLPPSVVSEKPENGTLHYNGDRVEIVFDEFVQLDNITENVIISPPQPHAPEIRAFGKKVLVTFADTLIPNTTYTIDFGNAICDNNEKIPYSGYTFSFSTGDHIDSLGLFGQIINAEDLNPISGISIGLQEILEDSAFETVPFTRLGRSDSLGYFSIQNIRPGKYRVYGLQDNSRDYTYQPGEGLAFNDIIYEPYARVEALNDSTEVVYLEPSDVVLWFFKEEKTPQYLGRALHEDKHLLRITFAAPVDSLPRLRALRPSEVDSTGQDGNWVNWQEHMVLQASARQDTLIYWLTDSAAMLDTLDFELTYRKTDSIYQLYWQTDTLRAVYHAPRLNARTQAKLNKQKAEQKLSFKTNARSGFEVYDTLRLTAATPLAEIWKDSIHLTQKVDTVIRDIPFELVSLDEAKMRYLLVARLEPAKDYTLTIDSAAMTDVFGHVNDRTKTTIKLKSMEDYATLRIHIANAPANLRIQLLDNKDNPVRDKAVVPGGTLFKYLPAASYYMRAYEDKNGDGKWTTGDWTAKRQPEPVYYFPARLTLRANWDFEEHFTYQEKPVLESKPYEIIEDGAKKLNNKKKK